MKSKKVLLICTMAFIATSSIFISCGKIEEGKASNDKKDEKNIPITEESSVDVKNEKLESKEVEETKINEEVKNIKPVDFSKYSDGFLIDFVNNGTDAFIKDLNTTSIVPYVYNVRKASYTELVKPIETIEKRQEIINKYYAPNVYNEEYVEKDGVTYFKTPYYRPYVKYKFKGVKSREVIDNNKLRVTFNVDFYYGYPKINKNYKTVEFSEIDGKLKAVTLFQDKSLFNISENGDSDYNMDTALDVQEEQLFDYVDEALQGVMNPEFIVNGINDRYYDKSTDSKYYAISVLEPKVCSTPYYVNIKNGAIYGVREGKFVVEPKR